MRGDEKKEESLLNEKEEEADDADDSNDDTPVTLNIRMGKIQESHDDGDSRGEKRMMWWDDTDLNETRESCHFSLATTDDYEEREGTPNLSWWSCGLLLLMLLFSPLFFFLLFLLLVDEYHHELHYYLLISVKQKQLTAWWWGCSCVMMMTVGDDHCWTETRKVEKESRGERGRQKEVLSLFW